MSEVIGDYNYSESRYGEHQSPFLSNSNVQWAWDSTSLGYLKECPRKYFLTMIEGWRKKDESVHLIFGSHFHKALERFDLFKAQGADDEEAIDASINLLLQETFGWVSNHPNKNRDTLLRSVIWYWEQYPKDIAKTVLLGNGKPAVELSFRFDTGIPCTSDVDYMLSGHMDRLVDFDGTRYVMDRKTTGGSLSSYYFNQYNPDNQMTLYSLASKIVYDMPVAGVIIDAAQIAVGFTSFARGITTRSEGQLNEWMQDLDIWFTTAAYYAEKNLWPMNEKSCNNYGGCAFKDICNKDPVVREKFLETDFERRYWNPLEVR